ncbi:MAG TPA: DUF2167 domain-containing protein [Candidatus Angelobacter sp.]|jgi:uncharacterized membrane-anchored protein
MKNNQRRVMQYFLALCKSKVLGVVLVGVIAATSMAVRGWAQEPTESAPNPQPKVHIDWQEGPTTAKLGDIAEIQIPAGYRFAGRDGAQKVLRLTHNIPNGRELGVIVGEKATWFMMFEFKEDGYVKDEEGGKLDNDAILKSIQEATEVGNQQRAKQGWPPFHVNGWQREPFYDPSTHNLTWAILGRGDDPKEVSTVNHSVRILGRRGTMNVDLIADREQYAALTDEFNSLMSGFHYIQGNRYSDFTKGDKVAEYGLTALILGGGAAVALKTGLLAKLWKFIVMGLVAAGAAIKKLFRSIFGKEDKIEDPNARSASQGQ